MKQFSTKIICGAVFIAFGFNTMAATIYNDAALYSTNLLQVANGLEIGNEISVAPNVWNLTNFSIEYFSSNATLNASLGVDVRFYMNNGTVTNGFAAPGTLIFDSGWFYNTLAGNLPGGANTIIYTSTDFNGGPVPLSIRLPGSFTFTVTFANLGTNNMSLPLASTQTGISYGDYWLYNSLSSQWTLMYNTNADANFVVNFAGGVVPEPSVLGLATIGGSLLFFGASRWKRKR